MHTLSEYYPYSAVLKWLNDKKTTFKCSSTSSTAEMVRRCFSMKQKLKLINYHRLTIKFLSDHKFL